MSVILLIVGVIVVVGMFVGLYNKNLNAVCKSKRRLDGKTTLVTGGTTGMGLEIAADFAHRGARVIVACPFEEEGLHGRKLIVRSSGNENVIFKLLDLSSLESIRKFVVDILKTEDRLDILVNNAGIGGPGSKVTADGINFVMQVNYYGAFLLTLLLLPLLKKSGSADEPSRIVNTASTLHKLGRINFDKLTIPRSDLVSYANSKLCVVLFTRQLAKRLKNTNVIVNAVNPGAVGTRIFHSTTTVFGSFISFIFMVLAKHPWEGAQTAIYAAMSLTAGKYNGEYFKECQISNASKIAYNDKLCLRLWEESIRVVKLTDKELAQIFEK